MILIIGEDKERKAVEELLDTLGKLAECTCGMRDSLSLLVGIEGQRLQVEIDILNELKKGIKKPAVKAVVTLGVPVGQ